MKAMSSGLKINNLICLHTFSL